MGRTYILDIESNNVDPRKVTALHCVALADLETGKTCVFGDMTLGADRPLEQLGDTLEKADTLVGHNIIGYDLPALGTLLGYTFKLPKAYDAPGVFNGRPIQIYDTLVMSKTNKPIRHRGGHSLKDWGLRLKCYKGDYEGPWDVASKSMYEYCRQDTIVTRKLFLLLKDEVGAVDYEPIWWVEQRVYDAVNNDAQHTGFALDLDEARTVLAGFKKKAAELEAAILPHIDLLPHTKKSEAEATPPRVQLLKSGGLSAAMGRFLERHNGKHLKGAQDQAVVLYGKTYPLPMPVKPVLAGRPAELSASAMFHIGCQLMASGWEPQEYKPVDLKVHTATGQPKTLEQYADSVGRFCAKIQGTKMVDVVAKELGCKPSQIPTELLQRYKKDHRVIVPSSPLMTIGPSKEPCPNLDKLGDSVTWVKALSLWATYKHRISILESQSGTGWINDHDVIQHGFIKTPADTCGANTFMFTHRKTVNVPTVESVGGRELRGLLKAGEGRLLTGCDAAGQEARVEGHYVFDYDPTPNKEYVESLTTEKSETYYEGVLLDVHQLTACKMFNIEDPSILWTKEGKGMRGKAKGLKYGIGYGAGDKKAASIVGAPEHQGAQIKADFWAAAQPLADLREEVIKEFDTYKAIKLIDGRWAYPRSPHSALNLLFQATGAVMTKHAVVWWLDQVEAEGLDAKLVIVYHDEFQVSIPEEEVLTKTFKTQKELTEFRQTDSRIWSGAHENEDKSLTIHYHRASELQVKAWEETTRILGFKVQMSGDYDVGKSWADTH